MSHAPRFPSTASLDKAFPGKGAAVRAALLRKPVADAEALARDGFPVTAAWVRQCYHPPGGAAIRMSCANEAAGTYGVEALHETGADDWRAGPFAEYLNTGDTYDLTLVRFRSGAYRMRSWGDVVEANPSRFR